MYQHILYSVDAPVATITMNRPDNLNAFTTRMLAEIRHALAQAERDEKVVGIVLTGAGRGFCAGMDMNALNSMSSGAGRADDDLSSLEAAPGDPVDGRRLPGDVRVPAVDPQAADRRHQRRVRRPRLLLRAVVRHALRRKDREVHDRVLAARPRRRARRELDAAAPDRPRSRARSALERAQVRRRRSATARPCGAPVRHRRVGHRSGRSTSNNSPPARRRCR